MRKFRIFMVGLAVAALGSALFASAASAAPAEDAQVSVVHGIPDTPVNVFVNGDSTLANFEPGTVAGPLSLPAGSYTVTIFTADNTEGTGTPVIEATADVKAGQNVTLVAHLDESGDPTLTPFANDTSAIPAGEARLIVRHVAAAPAVDVRANGEVAFTELTNPNEASAELPAGTVKADVVLAGTDTVAIGPAKLDLKAGADTIVYAIGSAEDSTLSLVTQTIDGLAAAPTAVPAGSAGLASPNNGLSLWGWALIAFGGLLLLGGGTAAFQRARS